MEDPEEILSAGMEDPEDHPSGEDPEATLSGEVEDLEMDQEEGPEVTPSSGEVEDPEMDQGDHQQEPHLTQGISLLGPEEVEHHHLEAHHHQQATRVQTQMTQTSPGSQTSKHTLSTGRSRNGHSVSIEYATCCMHKAWKRY